MQRPGRDVIPAAFTPDGRWFASTESDRFMQIRTLAGSQTLLHSLDVHPNGSRLATLGRVWDVESVSEVLTLPATTTPATYGKLVWSHDGE